MKKVQTSEWVSIGHPDKMADYISCYILDKFLEQDPRTRFAVEVQIKDNFVSLAGEIDSHAYITSQQIEVFVRQAIYEIGYTYQYQKRFGKDNTICDRDIEVVQHIGMQSRDIAQGVPFGWGDQGIFWGMAVNDRTTNYMPKDWFLARRIGLLLYESGIGGLDIKTQVTLADNELEEVVVAIPLVDNDEERVRRLVASHVKCQNAKIYVNGTGRYVKHGPVGDAGTTGRKLAVDFYGGNCRIGGGCPWTKDATKADLTLNVYARKQAIGVLVANNHLDDAYCSISCRIGSPEILVSKMDRAGELLESPQKMNIRPDDMIEYLGLNKPVFRQLCRNGLFSKI